MATAAARCCSCCRLQVRLRCCMAVVSAVGTGFVPRTSVMRRSMFDVTSTCDSHRAVTDNVCADVRLSHYADRFLRARAAGFDRASRSITRRIDWLRLGS